MKSIGTATIAGETYIIMIVHQRGATYYYLLSKYHREDQRQLIFGGELSHPVRMPLSYSTVKVDNNYIIAALMKKNIGGSIKAYGSYSLLLEVINGIQTAATYSFRSQDILLDDSSRVGPNLEPIRAFAAQDDEIMVEYEKVDGFISNLKYSSVSIEIEYQEEETYQYPRIKEINAMLLDLKPEDTGSRTYSSGTKTIDYEAVLRNMVDSSWYMERVDGQEVYHKQYKDISTKEEFEKEIIMGLVNELKKARAEGTTPLLISVDTETTGLHVYGVANDFQSTVVAIPISFKDNTGYVIYTDMEYFSNVPIEYVKERLEPFLDRDLLEDPVLTIRTMDGPFEFRRSEIFSTGHNTMFDIKAFAVSGMKVWYDADTMQMSFNLDPFLTKRKNSLKYITHKVLECWTPELADVLGAGNEDKFRFISDRRIACLYGGADGDFGRLVFKALKNIYKESEEFHRTDLFKAYLEQDVIPMNMVAGFDYNGIRIDRDRFVEEGRIVKEDMKIIEKFTYEYVGRMIAINNYLNARKRIIDTNTEIDSTIKLLLEENKDNPEKAAQRIAELRSWIRNPNSIVPPDLNKILPHEFKFAGDDLIKTLYETLKYPKLVMTEPPKSKSDGSKTKQSKPRPAVNKTAMKKLMSIKSKATEGYLKEDIMGTNKRPLILAKEFNSYKYPVAYLVSLIGPRKKEYDSYFAAFEKDSYGDRLCKESKFASIDTRRISNPIQTIKGSLKAYMLPHNDGYAMCDFDMSQVELRVMASIAKDIATVTKMNNPEVDSHTECASAMSVGIKDPVTQIAGIKDPATGKTMPKPPYLINKWERSNAKQVNFGYPYGLGPWSMCEKIFGEINHSNMADTYRIIEAFEAARREIVTFLNKIRELSVTATGTCEEEPIPIPKALRNYLEIGDDIPVGIVRNLKGFYKLFQLDDLTEKNRARIKRQSGNFPVQSFAAELFRIILIRLFKEFWRQGWIQKGWIKGHILVHDEFLFSFKKPEIHPVHLASIIHRCCTVQISGHTTYYIGINIGNSWGDCKKDSSELPVHCVKRLIERWDAGEFKGEVVDDPKNYMAKLRQQYISDRVWELVHHMRPDAGKDNINCGKILKNFENYTVRKYVYECFSPLWTPKEDSKGKEDEIDSFDSRLATWALDRFGDGVTFITSEKKEIKLHQDLQKLTRLVNNEMIPYTFEEMFEGKVIDLDDFLTSFAVSDGKETGEDDSYYQEVDWDLDGNDNPYFIDFDNPYRQDDDVFEDHFDFEEGETVENMRKIKPTLFNNMQYVNNRVTIKVYRRNHFQLIESEIANAGIKNKDGVQVWYLIGEVPVKGSRVIKDALPQLDAVVSRVRG